MGAKRGQRREKRGDGGRREMKEENRRKSIESVYDDD